MKKKALILRSVCSVLLLAYLLFKIDFSPLRETLSKFRPEFYILAIIGVCIYQCLNSLILKTLLSIKGNKAGIWEIFRLLTISIFFGIFLPGGVGPDIILAYNLSRSTPKKEDALSAIIFARMMILFIMLLTAFIISMFPGTCQPYIRNLASVLLIAFVLICLMLGSKKGLNLSRKLFPNHKWTNLIYQTHSAISSYGKSRKAILTLLPVFILTAFLKALIDYVIALSLSINISPMYFFVFVPLVSIATSLPVTISGFGVREGAYVKLFSSTGIEAANSFSISLLSFSLNLWFCIAGAILYGIKGSTLKIRKQEL